MNVTLETGQGLLYRAIPANGTVNLFLGKNSEPKAQWPNTLRFPEDVSGFLKDNTQTFWFSRSRRSKANNVPWVINSLSDPDEYPDALTRLDEYAAGKIPILNHPRAVCMSRKDLSAVQLAEVPDLEVPKCCRLTPKEFEDFERSVANGGFTYPVLVRRARSRKHPGSIKIDGPEDWEKLRLTPWHGVPHYITQFVETKLPTGEYLKARVVFVGGVSFVRHVKQSKTWNFPSKTDAPDEIFAGESQLVSALVVNETFKRICQAVPLATGLDYFKLDVSIDLKRNRFVALECNATMTLLNDETAKMTPALEARKQALEAPITTALTALLMRPGHWGRFLPHHLKSPESNFSALYLGVA